MHSGPANCAPGELVPNTNNLALNMGCVVGKAHIDGSRCSCCRNSRTLCNETEYTGMACANKGYASRIKTRIKN
jgi:hypothetical protein